MTTHITFPFSLNYVTVSFTVIPNLGFLKLVDVPVDMPQFSATEAEPGIYYAKEVDGADPHAQFNAIQFSHGFTPCAGYLAFNDIIYGLSSRWFSGSASKQDDDIKVHFIGFTSIYRLLDGDEAKLVGQQLAQLMQGE